jgi:hypothetical protein
VLVEDFFVDRGLACDVVRAKVRALREINRKMIDPQSQMKVSKPLCGSTCLYHGCD